MMVQCNQNIRTCEKQFCRKIQITDEISTETHVHSFESIFVISLMWLDFLSALWLFLLIYIFLVKPVLLHTLIRMPYTVIEIKLKHLQLDGIVLSFAVPLVFICCQVDNYFFLS